MTRKVFVTKAEGEREPFSVSKLRKSMADSGASARLIEDIVRKIKTHMAQGVSTASIHQLAFGLLKSADQSFAARYNLKKAIMRLGPEGFPFERYFAAVLKHFGYITTTNQIVQGRCITHEVDIIAEKHQQNIHAIIEAKFHSRPGRKTGSKDALYTYSRFLDISAAWQIKKKSGAKPQKAKLQGWLVTNTEMTINAIRYCECVGLKVIAWSYPNRNESLQGMIHHRGLYPITALLTLNHNQQKQLLRHNVIICSELLENPSSLRKVGLKNPAILRVMSEVTNLCGKQ